MNDEMHKYMRSSNALAQINPDNLHPRTAESGFIEHFVKLVCGLILTRINAENNISHQSHLNLSLSLSLSLPRRWKSMYAKFANNKTIKTISIAQNDAEWNRPMMMANRDSKRIAFDIDQNSKLMLIKLIDLQTIDSSLLTFH